MTSESPYPDLTPIRAALARTRALYCVIPVLIAVAMIPTTWVVLNPNITTTSRLIFAFIGVVQLCAGLFMIGMVWRFRDIDKTSIWIRLNTIPRTLLWVYENEAQRLSLRFLGRELPANTLVYFCFLDGKRFGLSVDPKCVEKLLLSPHQAQSTLLIGFTKENLEHYNAQTNTRSER